MVYVGNEEKKRRKEVSKMRTNMNKCMNVNSGEGKCRKKVRGYLSRVERRGCFVKRTNVLLNSQDYSFIVTHINKGEVYNQAAAAKGAVTPSVALWRGGGE